MLTDAEIDTAVRQIVVRLRPRVVYLFGSYAKGSATATSDLDLLAVVDTGLPAPWRAPDAPRYLPDSLVPLDLVVYTPEEMTEYARDPFSLVSSVLRHGRVAFRTGAGD